MLQQWLRFLAGLATGAFYALLSSVSMPPTLTVTVPPGPVRQGQTPKVELRVRCDGFAPLRRDLFEYFELTLSRRSTIPHAPVEGYLLDGGRFTWRPDMRWCWHETVTGVFPLPPIREAGTYELVLKYFPQTADADEQNRLATYSPPTVMRVLGPPRAALRKPKVAGLHHAESDGC